MHRFSDVVCLRLEHSVICQTFAPAWRRWRSCYRSRPPAFITSFAAPAVNALQSALHDRLTDEPSQPTGLTTPALQECFHGNRLRSCEKKQETERERQTDVNLQHGAFPTSPPLSRLLRSSTSGTKIKENITVQMDVQPVRN